MVSATQLLQVSWAADGLPVAEQPLNASDTQVSGKVMISGVNVIDPDESTNTLIRFFTGWAELVFGNPSVINSDANSDTNTRHRGCVSFPIAPD